MQLSSLNAISPIDGRYRSKVNELAPFFSEEALIKYRVLVEIEYFIALCEIPLPQLKGVNSSVFDDLRAIYKSFSTEDALAIKKIESVTNHDVKAVEYFIKEKYFYESIGGKEKKACEQGIIFGTIAIVLMWACSWALNSLGFY